MNNTNTSALIIPPSGTNTAAEDIHGIKSPVEIPSAWAWVWWALAVAALAALAWRGWRYWQKRKERPVESVVLISPHEKALEKLREALGLLGQPRPFCISVSDIVRVYLGERFNLHAPERTTEEFLEELQTS